MSKQYVDTDGSVWEEASIYEICNTQCITVIVIVLSFWGYIISLGIDYL